VQLLVDVSTVKMCTVGVTEKILNPILYGAIINSDHMLPNGLMTVDDYKGSGKNRCGKLFKVLSRHFRGGTANIYGNPEPG
jgi:hypothetical protein